MFDKLPEFVITHLLEYAIKNINQAINIYLVSKLFKYPLANAKIIHIVENYWETPWSYDKIYNIPKMFPNLVVLDLHQEISNDNIKPHISIEL